MNGFGPPRGSKGEKLTIKGRESHAVNVCVATLKHLRDQRRKENEINSTVRHPNVERDGRPVA